MYQYYWIYHALESTLHVRNHCLPTMYTVSCNHGCKAKAQLGSYSKGNTRLWCTSLLRLLQCVIYCSVTLANNIIFWGKQQQGLFSQKGHTLHNNNILQAYISTVSLLTDGQLAELGVDKVGDRAILRKQCRDCIHSK